MPREPSTWDGPIAVMMLGILDFVLDTDGAHDIVRRIMAALPSGSCLALTHPPAGAPTSEARATSPAPSAGPARRGRRRRETLRGPVGAVRCQWPGDVSRGGPPGPAVRRHVT